MIADDLFAGAGGWDLAATKLGIHARGIENMKEARATRDAAGLTTIHDDVWTYRPGGQASGLIASPPCQTFSAAGSGSGRKALDDVLRGIRDNYVSDIEHLRFLGEEVGDQRTALVLTPLHFALTGGYEWLAWEQVPTVLPVWEACAERLRQAGWNVWTGLLYSEQYGVPQTRKRAFLLASRSGPVAPPLATHSRYYSHAPDKLDAGVRRWVSMADALGWGLSERPSPTVTGGGTETGGAEPIAKWEARWPSRPDFIAYSPDRATAQASLRRGGTPGWCGSPSGLTGPCHRPVTHPAATVTGAGNYSLHTVDSCGVLAVDGADGTRVSVAEAGVLQSFPADYPWCGKQGRQYLQAGNAVPPGMAGPALAAAAGINAEEVAA